MLGLWWRNGVRAIRRDPATLAIVAFVPVPFAAAFAFLFTTYDPHQWRWIGIVAGAAYLVTFVHCAATDVLAPPWEAAPSRRRSTGLAQPEPRRTCRRVRLRQRVHIRNWDDDGVDVHLDWSDLMTGFDHDELDDALRRLRLACPHIRWRIAYHEHELGVYADIVVPDEQVPQAERLADVLERNGGRWPRYGSARRR